MEIPRRLKILFAALFLFFISTTGVLAQEVIKEFRSHIVIDKSGTLLVTEIIDLNSEGHLIKKGIYRDFPTIYKRKDGSNIEIPFSVVQVTKDDHKEPWRIRKLSNGIRIYIGDPDKTVENGTHRYSLTYRVERAIGFYDRYDELYWNATGNDWAFPIENATCEVHLPFGATPIQAGAWTGKQGSREQNVEMASGTEGDFIFRTTRPLVPGQGLTIAISWPKGFVPPPSGTKYFITDHGLELVFGITGIAGFLTFLFLWIKVGKDPKKGTIIPRFTPPGDLSPAVLRQVMQMNFDDRSFASAIISLAVKGYVIISQESKKYRITKSPMERTRDKLASEERRIYDILLGTRDSILLTSSNCNTIGSARNSLKDSLEVICYGYYRKNWGYAALALAIMAVILTLGTLMTSSGGNTIIALFTSFIATITASVLVGLVGLMKKSWRETSGIKAAVRVISIVAAMTALVIVFMVCLLVVVGTLPKWCSITLPLIALTPAIFIPLMKTVTLEGRKLSDEIEGFSLYLKVAEEDRLNLINPPEKTPELFERYLPYALALGVEQQWGEKFSSILSETSQNSVYSPLWYSGMYPIYMGGLGDFASDMGSSFSSVIASSRTAPGSGSAFSGSGGGGGGFSGGGGGGGGGGGW